VSYVCLVAHASRIKTRRWRTWCWIGTAIFPALFAVASTRMLVRKPEAVASRAARDSFSKSQSLDRFSRDANMTPSSFEAVVASFRSSFLCWRRRRPRRDEEKLEDSAPLDPY